MIYVQKKKKQLLHPLSLPESNYVVATVLCPFCCLVSDVFLVRGALLSWHGSSVEKKREEKLGYAYSRHYEGREVGERSIILREATKLLNCHSCFLLKWVKVFVGDYSLFLLDFFRVVGALSMAWLQLFASPLTLFFWPFGIFVHHI